MTGSPPFASADGAPAADPSAGAATPASGAGAPALAERPEVLVGAAFAGGVVLALLLKRAGRVS